MTECDYPCCVRALGHGSGDIPDYHRSGASRSRRPKAPDLQLGPQDLWRTRVPNRRSVYLSVSRKFVPPACGTTGGHVFTRICLLTGGTYHGWEEGYLPWKGGAYPGPCLVPTLAGGTYLGHGGPTLDTGVPTLVGGTYSGWGRLPTLDRLCHRQYASCGFPQEDFLVMLWNYEYVPFCFNHFFT